MKQEYNTMLAAFNCAELAHWFDIRCKLYRTAGVWYVEFN
jgi:hypothetical protein